MIPIFQHKKEKLVRYSFLFRVSCIIWTDTAPVKQPGKMYQVARKTGEYSA